MGRRARTVLLPSGALLASLLVSLSLGLGLGLVGGGCDGPPGGGDGGSPGVDAGRDAGAGRSDGGGDGGGGGGGDAGADGGGDAGPARWRLEHLRTLLEGLDYTGVSTESAERSAWTGRYFVLWGSCDLRGNGGMHVYDEQGAPIGARHLCRDSQRSQTYDHAWQAVADVDVVGADQWFMCLGAAGYPKPRPGVLYGVGEGAGGFGIQLLGRSSAGEGVARSEGHEIFVNAEQAAVAGGQVLVHEHRFANVDLGVSPSDPRTGHYEVLLALPSLTPISERPAAVGPRYGLGEGVVIGDARNAHGVGVWHYFELRGAERVDTGEVAPRGALSADASQLAESVGAPVAGGGASLHRHWRREGSRLLEAESYLVPDDTAEVTGTAVAGDFVMHGWRLFRRGAPVRVPPPEELLPGFGTPEVGSSVFGVSVSEGGYVLATTGRAAFLLHVVPDE